MTYSIIEARTKTEEHSQPTRREIGAQVFSRIKYLLDHDIICFMHLGEGRGFIRVVTRPFNETLRQRIEAEFAEKYPWVDLAFAESLEKLPTTGPS